MAVDPERVRELALNLAGSAEVAHQGRAAFRTSRKIFATLAADGLDLNLMFDADMQAFYIEQDGVAFSPVPGGWGRTGATRCSLAHADDAILRSALQAAHALAAPSARRR